MYLCIYNLDFRLHNTKQHSHTAGAGNLFRARARSDFPEQLVGRSDKGKPKNEDVYILQYFYCKAVKSVDGYGVPFSHLFTELQISAIEVHISPIQLQISTIDLQISTIQLEISPNRLNCRYLQLNWRYLQLNCRYLQFDQRDKITAPRRKNHQWHHLAEHL